MQFFSSVLTRIRFIITIVVFFFMPTPASCVPAEIPLWQDMGIDGGQVLSLAINLHNPAHLFAGTWCGDGLFYSSDAGVSWTALPDSASARFRNCEVFDITLDPSDPATIWVAKKQEVDVSTDGGQTWRACVVAPNRFVYSLAVDPHDTSGNTIYAGTSGIGGAEMFGALYRTQDRGIHWECVLHVPHDVLDVSINPLRENQIFAVSAPWSEPLRCTGIVYRSDDAGVTWVAQNNASLPDGSRQWFGCLDEILVLQDTKQTALVCGRTGVAHTTTCAGQATEWHWAFSFPDIVTNALCATRSLPVTIYASSSDGIRTSTDHGITWGDPAPAPLFLCMQAHPENAAYAYGGSVNRGVYMTSDYGISWKPSERGIRANTVYATAIAPHKPDRIICATLAGIFIKQAEGSWSLINDRAAYAVAFHPENDVILYAGFDNMVGKSTDNGSTWTYLRIPDVHDSHDITALQVSPHRPHTLFAAVGYDTGTRGCVVRISDNNTSFANARCATVLETPAPVNTIAAHVGNPSTLFAGTGWFYAPGRPGAVYVSNDGGWHWSMGSLQNVVINALAVSPANACTVYAACGDSGSSWAGIYKSSDCGATWMPITNGLPMPCSVVDIVTADSDPNRVYVGLYDTALQTDIPLGGVYASVDAGAYWTQIGLSDYALRCISLMPKTFPYVKQSSRASFSLDNSATIIAGTESGLFSAATSGIGMLFGSVVSEESGMPVDGVVITCNLGLSCISSSGYYSLLLPAGEYTLQAKAAGYLPATISGIIVPCGGIIERTINLRPAGYDTGTRCVAEELLDGNGTREICASLRCIRNAFMMYDQEGVDLVTLYYGYEADIRAILASDVQLAHRCKDFLIRAASYSGFDPVFSILQNTELLNEGLSLLHYIELKAPSHLKKRIRHLSQQLPKMIRRFECKRTGNRTGITLSAPPR
ncbi:MAG: hypothetical protein N3B18_05025 [Desulfobacterota bacterium]|nr:hypothetical protein [Thermodesulfobacteriota bacterium]